MEMPHRAKRGEHALPFSSFCTVLGSRLRNAGFHIPTAATAVVFVLLPEQRQERIPCSACVDCDTKSTRKSANVPAHEEKLTLHPFLGGVAAVTGFQLESRM